jgi:hypothetical protein
MVPMWMFPVALACGNAFILKLSEPHDELTATTFSVDKIVSFCEKAIRGIWSDEIPSFNHRPAKGYQNWELIDELVNMATLAFV